MKKLTWFELAMVGIGIIASCFVVSFLVKCKFNLETDFLSSAATIFAAVVAMLLYSDWREEYLIKKLEDIHASIEEVTISLKEQHAILIDKSSKGIFVNRVMPPYKASGISDDDVDEELEQALANFKKYLKLLLPLLTEYIVFLINYNSDISMTHAEKVEEYRLKIIDLVIYFSKIDGIVSAKPLLLFLCNELMLEKDLNKIVDGLCTLAYENRTDFFYKILNK